MLDVRGLIVWHDMGQGGPPLITLYVCIHLTFNKRSCFGKES